MAAAALAAPASAIALPLLSHHGRWLTDARGRVVILHGLQVDKFRPTAPIEYIDLDPANVAFMAAQGFNLARVSLAYAGAEPTMGHIDESYIDSYLAFDRQLAQAGVYDLVDMMQGQYSAQLNGWGFPDWMTLTDGLPNGNQPFPQGYFANPAEERAWDNLWGDAAAADGVGLQEHYAAGVAHIASRFGASPGLLGFEILNEPWPGSSFATCTGPTGCPPGGFDQTSMTSFYRRQVPAVRAADPRHLIFYEPNLLFDFGAATGLGAISDPNLVFAFHNYCLAYDTTPGSQPSTGCGSNEQSTLANADSYQRQTGVGLLMDEWGNTTDTTTIDRLAQEADQDMVGWSDWALEDCCKSAAAVIKDGTQPPTAPGNVNTPVLDALVRAYPQVVAGTPSSWSYDPGSATFAMTYSTTMINGASGSGMESDIFVPSVHFPTGYRVKVGGASVVSAPSAGTLRLCNSPGATSVNVTVTPDAGGSTDAPDGSPASSPACPGSANTTASGGLPLTVSGGGGQVSVSGVGKVRVPRTGTCLSKRRFVIHVALQRGVRLLGASARLGGRRFPIRVGGRLQATVDLRGLPRGRFRLVVTLRIRRDGRVVTLRLTRNYRTCVPARR